MYGAMSSSNTQPANSVSRRVSDMSTQSAGIWAGRFSEMTKQPPESGLPVIGIVATQASDSDAIRSNEFSTQSCKNDSRG